MTGDNGKLDSWGITVYGHSVGVGAPAIASVTPDSGTLVVAWMAPAGVSGVTAYDLRHIETSADEMVDADWTLTDNAWTSGELWYKLEGLTDGTQYDVQVRAVASGVDGPWSATETGTPGASSSTAPTLDSVRADDGALVVTWSAPADTGGATSTVYDVRYIRGDATDKTDSNWSVEDDAWMSGALRYAVTGLTNGVGYDVQVRAVNDGVDGPWSAAGSGTPADHGDTLAAATTVAPDTRVSGFIQSAGDADYFKFVLSRQVDVWIYTTGALDSVGDLLDSKGLSIDSNDDGRVSPNPRNFFLWRTLAAGTYYVKVVGFEASQGPYVLRVRTFVDTRSRSDAAELKLGGLASATIDPDDDVDYFRLELSEAADVVIRSSGFPDTVADLLDSRGQTIASNDDGYLPGGVRNFLIHTSLTRGVYYVRVEAFISAGPYAVYANAVTEPGSTLADARPLTLGVAAGGSIDPAGDVDYFSITVDESTYVVIRAVSDTATTTGALLDDNGMPVAADFTSGPSRTSFGPDIGFTIRDRLDAGTYYVKVAAATTTETGRYTIRAVEETAYARLVDRCSDISRPTGINDALYGCQWHLSNVGQFSRGARQDINVEAAWTSGALGAGVTVAVVDDGMHHGHEDLTANVDATRNHDYTGGGDIYDPYETHGTAVAGIIAARDNGIGVRGVAPRATIYGYNYLLVGGSANRADAMSRNSTTTAISNNSWGPPESGGPQFANIFWELAVRSGVTTGYDGKGVLYVWSAGNGGDDGDYSNLDEIANYYAVTAVCAVNHADVRSSYSERGSNLWVCGPSSDNARGMQGIATTDNGNRYRDDFGGTSAATPIVSGVAALVRGVNGTLTWRDVKLILAASARKNDADDSGWQEGALKYGSNTERYSFNHEYGFGMVDAGAAVDLARSWTNVPAFREISAETADIELAIPDAGSTAPGASVSSSVTVDPYVGFVEYIQVDAHFDHPSFRDLEVELVSPSGAVSVLTPDNGALSEKPLTTNFRFGSAKHLGEDAAGVWTLRITDHHTGEGGMLKSWKLTAYGHGFSPGPPEVATTTPVGGGGFTVVWTAPSDTGSSAVTSYDLRYIRDDAPDRSDDQWSLLEEIWTSGALSYSLTGLEGDVEYVVQVRAINDTGSGPWSKYESGKPETVAPPAPSISSVSAGNRVLSVVWTAPAGTGGADITSYDIRHIATSADETVDANWTVLDRRWTSGPLVYAVTGLDNGTEYDVQVRAVNSEGDGAWSATVTGTPTQDNVTVNLSWESTAYQVDESAGTVTLRAVAVTTAGTAPAANFSFEATAATADGTAALSDYAAASSTLTFTASDFSQTTVNGATRYRAVKDFVVDVKDDAIDESDETFTAALTYTDPGLPHLRGGRSTATVTIADDDHVPVTIAWDRSSVTVDEGAGTVTLNAVAVTTLDKLPDTGFSFDVSVSLSGGDAVEPDDYTGAFQTVTFTRTPFRRSTVDGRRRYRGVIQVTVPIVDDTIDEPDESFDVTLAYSNPSLPHLQGGPSTMSVTITDNDHVPVTISFEEASFTVNEDVGTVTLRAVAVTTKDKMPESGFSFGVSVSTAEGTASQNEDYRRLNATESFRLRDFQRATVNGQQRYRAVREVTVRIVDDTDDEPVEAFTVNVAYTNPALPYLQGAPAAAAITIIDNDHVPVVLGWEQTAFTAEEGTTVTLRAVAVTTKDKMPESGFSFDFTASTANGSARQPADYSQLSDTVTFTRSNFSRTTVNGQSRYRAERTFTVSVVSDSVRESDENFTVNLAYSNPSLPYLSLGDRTATITVTDDLSTTVDLTLQGFGSPFRVSRGDELIYDYTLSNSGPATSTNTTVVTTLDRGVSFVAATSTAACTHSGRATGGTVTCRFGTLSGERNGVCHGRGAGRFDGLRGHHHYVRRQRQRARQGAGQQHGHGDRRARRPAAADYQPQRPPALPHISTSHGAGRRTTAVRSRATSWNARTAGTTQ